MKYEVRIPVERQEFASLAGALGLKFSDKGEDLPVGVTIKGTLTKPDIGLNLEEASKILAKEVGDKVEKEVEKAVDKLKDDPNIKKGVEDLKNKLGGFKKK